MTISAARISRISFHTDMTRAGAPVIPLGVMIEAVVPERARWLGLIGRPRLVRLELDMINLRTWPQLDAPFAMMTDMFEQAWEAGPGLAGSHLSGKFGSSALSVLTNDSAAVSQVLKADTAADWAITRHALLQSLETFEAELVPCVTTPVLPLARTPDIKFPEIQSQVRQGGIKRAA